MKFLKAKTDSEALSTYIGISGLNVSKCLASESYGLVALEETTAKAILTNISLQDKVLGAVIISQSVLRSMLQIQDFKQ